MNEAEFRQRVRHELALEGDDFDSLAAVEAVLYLESLGVTLSEEAALDIRDLGDPYFYFAQAQEGPPLD